MLQLIELLRINQCCAGPTSLQIGSCICSEVEGLLLLPADDLAGNVPLLEIGSCRTTAFLPAPGRFPDSACRRVHIRLSSRHKRPWCSFFPSASNAERVSIIRANAKVIPSSHLPRCTRTQRTQHNIPHVRSSLTSHAFRAVLGPTMGFLGFILSAIVCWPAGRWLSILC